MTGVCTRCTRLVQQSRSKMTLTSKVVASHPQPWFLRARARQDNGREKQMKVANAGLRSFIEKITARPKEARMWLKYFTSSAESLRAFAVLQLDSSVFSDPSIMDTFYWSTAFLYQNGLKPVLVFEVGEDEDELSSKVLALQAGLQQHGVSARLLGALNSVLSTSETADGKEDITANSTYLSQCLQAGELPLVANIVLDSCTMLPRTVDLFSATEAVAVAMKPLKTMLLNCREGVMDADNGVVVSDIILPSDLSPLQQKPWFTEKLDRKVQRIGGLLNKLPTDSSVIITRADTVIKELFTHHGVGTMIKRADKIVKYSSLNEVNLDRLRTLIEQSFDKKLHDNYWERIESRLEGLFVSEHYCAAAIILKEEGVAVPYLDKIAVASTAQGSGIAALLWNETVKNYPKLFWRSKRANRVAVQWYYAVSQGSWKANDTDWTVFWYGLGSSKEVWELVERALQKPEAFSNHND